MQVGQNRLALVRSSSLKDGQYRLWDSLMHMVLNPG